MELQELKTMLEEGVPKEIEVTEEELVQMYRHFDNLFEEELDKQIASVNKHEVEYKGKTIELKITDKK